MGKEANKGVETATEVSDAAGQGDLDDGMGAERDDTEGGGSCKGERDGEVEERDHGRDLAGVGGIPVGVSVWTARGRVLWLWRDRG